MSESLCTDDPGMEWLSNISEASGSSDDGTRFEIMWDNDPNLPMMSQGDYIVAFMNLEMLPLSSQILMAVSKISLFSMCDSERAKHFYSLNSRQT